MKKIVAFMSIAFLSLVLACLSAGFHTYFKGDFTDTTAVTNTSGTTLSIGGIWVAQMAASSGSTTVYHVHNSYTNSYTNIVAHGGDAAFRSLHWLSDNPNGLRWNNSDVIIIDNTDASAAAHFQINTLAD